LRPVDEGVDVEEFEINKPGRFKTGSCRWKIKAPDQDVNVAGIADGVLVNSGDPFCHGVATNHRVWDSGGVERVGCSPQPLFDLFRGHERPFPTEGFDCCFCHEKSSL
jgi:hypothetical protein